MSDTSFHVLNPALGAQFVTCGARDVWFDENGLSDPLTQEEYARLLTIPGFLCVEAWHAAHAPEFSGDMLPAELPEPVGGLVETALAVAGALFCGGDPVADLGDAEALPAEGEAPEHEETAPPLPDYRTLFAAALKLSDTEAAQSLLGTTFPELVDTWCFQSAQTRAALVTANHTLTGEALVELLNREAHGKNARSVLAAIEAERDGRRHRSPQEINRALVLASTPAPAPEE
jgi:hypothetical protein